MDFESFDGYLLEETPSKAQIVQELLATLPRAADAAAFYEGLRQLGARTPDLALIALRLVLAGHKADDETVKRVRDLVARARAGDASAKAEYSQVVGSQQ